MKKVSASFKSFVEEVLRIPQEFRDELQKKADSYYRQPAWCNYKPLGMYVIGLLRHACSSDKLTRFYAQLCEYDGEFRERFDFKKMPAYSTVAHFFNTRVGLRASELVDEGKFLLEQACQTLGLTLGKVRSTDGKVLASTNKEAVYNPHYKKTMFKGIIDWDLNLIVPLKSFCAGGVADERPYAKQSHEQFKHLRTELDVLDGGYYSLEMYCLNHHTPTLIHFPEGTTASDDPAKEVLDAYRKHWQEEDYDANASLEKQLRFLLAKQDFDSVGRYYRDLQVLESIHHSEDYQHKKHKRSLVETGNSLLDNRGSASRVRHASMVQAERDLHWTCHVLQVQKLMQLCN